MIIDSFPYFNEKELLEFRIKYLNDVVDHFIITESNQSYRGLPRKYEVKNLIQELGLPEEKITVIEYKYPEFIEPTEIDYFVTSKSGNGAKDINVVRAWTRERTQRDAFVYRSLDMFSDNDIFICGDLDEIVNADVVKYFASIKKKYPDEVFKIPLVWLENRADLRSWDKETDKPIYCEATIMATKNQLTCGGAARYRINYVPPPYVVSYVTEAGQVIYDCGWHFTWMGDGARLKRKMQNCAHYKEESDYFVTKKLDSQETLDRLEKYKATEGAMNPIGQTNVEMRKYDISNLPKIIFDLPRVKNFLLPEE